MDPISQLALTLGLGWASGLKLYAAVVTLGLLHNMGFMSLPPELELLASPLVIGVAGLLCLIEFFADKIPGFDSFWDALHTFIRIPVGALLAAHAVGDVHPALALAAGLGGGSLAAATHLAKSGARLAINTSPEPFSNWAASISEDIMVVGGLWLVVQHPLVFLGLLALFVLLVAWLAPKLFRFLRALFVRIAGWFRGDTSRPVV
mgnify:FL=1|jgi:hypothetical protein